MVHKSYKSAKKILYRCKSRGRKWEEVEGGEGGGKGKIGGERSGRRR